MRRFNFKHLVLDIKSNCVLESSVVFLYVFLQLVKQPLDVCQRLFQSFCAVGACCLAPLLDRVLLMLTVLLGVLYDDGLEEPSLIHFGDERHEAL